MIKYIIEDATRILSDENNTSKFIWSTSPLLIDLCSCKNLLDSAIVKSGIKK